MPVTDDMRDPATPDDVILLDQAEPPYEDPTLGVQVLPVVARGEPRNRLVAIGDSLTHGFMSGAIFRTDVSYPAQIANALGWRDYRYPRYEDPNGPGGLPFDLERFARAFFSRYGDRVDWWEVLSAARWARKYMDAIEDYWERGSGSKAQPADQIPHNLGIYGWDVRDALSVTADVLAARIAQPKDNLLSQLVENDLARAGTLVLGNARAANGKALTQLDAAVALGAEGTDEDQDGPGIETLIVWLGANNALPTVTKLKLVWSADGYDEPDGKGTFTVWRPSHFQLELGRLVEKVKKIRARHVIFGTVPHVTIAPIARGVGDKVRRGSRYFPFYTRVWIRDHEFDPADDPHITDRQARAVDSAIAQFNGAIAKAVEAARKENLDWYLFDAAALLDRLAARRYLNDPLARPEWWTPYDLPEPLKQLHPVPDTRFFSASQGGRTQGGLFSLDGVHPTTIGYGIIAQEIIKVMSLAGVKFRDLQGNTLPAPVTLDFERLLLQDTLLRDPPKSIGANLALMGWLDEAFDIVKRVLPFGSR